MTQTPQNVEIVPEQEATTLSFDEILKQDDECMAYLKIGNMKQAISQAYQRGRDEREQEIAKDMLSAIERQGRTLGTLSGFEFWATDVSNKAKK